MQASLPQGLGETALGCCAGMSTGEEAEEGVGWWIILQESVAGAPSCESELGELVTSASALARSLGRCLLWALIFLELALMALVSGIVAALAPLLPQVSTSGARILPSMCLRPCFGPGSSIHAIPPQLEYNLTCSKFAA